MRTILFVVILATCASITASAEAQWLRSRRSSSCPNGQCGTTYASRPTVAYKPASVVDKPASDSAAVPEAAEVAPPAPEADPAAPAAPEPKPAASPSDAAPAAAPAAEPKKETADAPAPAVPAPDAAPPLRRQARLAIMQSARRERGRRITSPAGDSCGGSAACVNGSQSVLFRMGQVVGWAAEASAHPTRLPLQASLFSGPVLSQPDFVVPAILVVLQFDQAQAFHFFEQIGEIAVAVVGFVEVRVDAADGLFEHRTPERVVVEFQRLDDLDQPVDGLLLLVAFLLRTLGRSPRRGIPRGSGRRSK